MGRGWPLIHLRRMDGGLRATHLNRSNEAIAPPGKCLHKSGIFSRIPQSLSQPIHSAIQALVEIHKRIGGPELLLQFLSCDHSSRVLDQDGEYLERLALEGRPVSVSSEFGGLQVELEFAKA